MLHQTTLPFKRGTADSAAASAVSSPEERPPNKRHAHLKDIAASTMRAIKDGSVTINGAVVDLDAKIRFCTHHTRYYAPDDAALTAWATSPSARATTRPGIEISVLAVSTLEGARRLSASSSSSSSSTRGRVALLSFASATRPGGGFLSGAQAQEESLARSSTLYPALTGAAAQRFYRLHARDRQGGLYHHALVYAPGVVVLRDDGGAWATPPFEVDVLSGAAVNAGAVRTVNRRRTRPADAHAVEARIAAVMRERMARILCLFERRGARNVVLGSFGTGVFRNDVEVVCGIWAELLTAPDARFAHSFDRVVFAILGTQTYETFLRRFPKNE